jgi:hypothetical protein
MLIVRHVECGGHESVMPCRSVGYEPPEKDQATDWPEGCVLAYGCDPKLGGAVDADGVCRFGDGRVFVMSIEGRTVANYDLGRPRPISNANSV